MSRGERVLGYARASESAGLETQRAAIAAACAHHGWEFMRVPVATNPSCSKSFSAPRALGSPSEP